jgi:Cys-tRNA(Pro)/Cys-tRNA(Cys) deacylase
MHVLEAQGIAYQVISFPDTIHDALGVAAFAGLPAEMVYKTLVVQALEPRDRKPLLILVAADRTLDTKRVARALGLRRVEMARQVDAERLTGLKVGGISALALIGKGFAVYIDERARDLREMVVSAGRRGLNLRLAVQDFVRVTGAGWIDAGRPA